MARPFDGLRAREISLAAAVDLESGLLAEATLATGLPFIVIRAILASIARSPAQIPRLIALALETRRALSTLRRMKPALELEIGGI